MAKTATQIAISDALDTLNETARDAGVPPDSVLRFLTAGYCPLPKQLQFHAAARECDKPDGPVEVGFGGARGPGKSSAVICQIGIDDCQRVAGLKVLFLRRVGKAARESFGDLRRKFLMHVPHDYKEHQGIVTFPNESRIILGHFNTEKDIDAYLGLEYDVIAIEESTQLTAQKHQEIATCLRTSKLNWRPRMYHTTNPGGVSHSLFKQKYILPWRTSNETSTRFIPATVDDNPFVNVEYRRNLEALTGWKRAAWLEGEWDIAAGQFFSTWRNEVHTCKPFEIPAWWPVWASLDYGFTHPTAVYLLTEFDGILYVVAEHVQAKRLPPQHAADIKGMFGRLGISMDRLEQFVAGQDVFANRGDATAKTIADQYSEQDIELLPAVMDRINGASEILKRLGDSERGEAPTIQVFDTCVRLIECLPALVHNPNRPEDVLKVDADEDGNGGDDTYDALRYGCMARVGVAAADLEFAAAFGWR